jgi:hypothetical protein
MVSPEARCAVFVALTMATELYYRLTSFIYKKGSAVRHGYETVRTLSREENQGKVRRTPARAKIHFRHAKTIYYYIYGTD